ncbi:MAG: hypothetical protein HYZ42_09065 [Bacteroidetes bacterium]|nr:hypothetical protein [Bacteroidota bacterium]
MTNNTSSKPGSGHFISLSTAITMTSTYRSNKESILIPDKRGLNILLNSETFNRSAFDALLAQPGCAGIRIYFGMTMDNKIRVIAVGVNAQDSDMLPGDEQAVDEFVIVEEGLPCPELCPAPSPLNE